MMDSRSTKRCIENIWRVAQGLSPKPPPPQKIQLDFKKDSLPHLFKLYEIKCFDEIKEHHKYNDYVHKIDKDQFPFELIDRINKKIIQLENC